MDILLLLCSLLVGIGILFLPFWGCYAIYRFLAREKKTSQKFGVNLMGQFVDMETPIIESIEKSAGRKLTKSEKRNISNLLLSSSNDNNNHFSTFWANRDKKRNIIIGVIEYIEIAHKIEGDISDFYELDKCIECLNARKENLKKLQPTTEHFSIAFRFCSLKHFNQVCDGNIEELNLKNLEDWENYTPKWAEKAAKCIIPAYKEYWDDVLFNYKRKDAKIKRLNYLIEKTEMFSTRTYITNSQENIQLMQELKAYYKGMLDSIR